jgi:hypothetical protein
MSFLACAAALVDPYRYRNEINEIKAKDVKLRFDKDEIEREIQSIIRKRDEHETKLKAQLTEVGAVICYLSRLRQHRYL